MTPASLANHGLAGDAGASHAFRLRRFLPPAIWERLSARGAVWLALGSLMIFMAAAFLNWTFIEIPQAHGHSAKGGTPEIESADWERAVLAGSKAASAEGAEILERSAGLLAAGFAISLVLRVERASVSGVARAVALAMTATAALCAVTLSLRAVGLAGRSLVSPTVPVPSHWWPAEQLLLRDPLAGFIVSSCIARMAKRGMVATGLAGLLLTALSALAFGHSHS